LSGYAPDKQPVIFPQSIIRLRPAPLQHRIDPAFHSALQPNADTAALIDKSALGRYPPNDIFSSLYPRHFAATLTRILASNAICGVKL
jgi:hypothetical protein